MEYLDNSSNLDLVQNSIDPSCLVATPCHQARIYLASTRRVLLGTPYLPGRLLILHAMVLSILWHFTPHFVLPDHVVRRVQSLCGKYLLTKSGGLSRQIGETVYLLMFLRMAFVCLPGLRRSGNGSSPFIRVYYRHRAMGGYCYRLVQ